MPTMFKAPILVVLFTLLAACQTTAIGKQTTENVTLPVINNGVDEMRVVTWNVEHLAYPIENGCKPRTQAEIAKLKMYAEKLEADIVGLQEVGSERAVRMLFPEDEWQVVMSARPDSDPYECRENGFTSTQQKVAFAVKKDIPILAVTNHEQFMLDRPGLRYGLAITVDTPLGPTEILNLHMKSGCFVDNYSRRDTDACQTLARQVPLLQGLVAKYEASGKPYLVIGDFNHRITAPYNRMTQMLKRKAPSLAIATQYMIGCHRWYPAPIDNIVVGNTNPAPIQKTAKAIDFADMTVENMLSDHCAVQVDLQPADEFMTTALTWLKTSKEFELMTLGAYARAEQSLAEMDLPENNWVVVMDVDETVLDNSDYEKMMIAAGTSYTTPTWDLWVASEKAIEVPGAKKFIEKVFSMGGKVAFITNREKRDDDHTWRNMLSEGIAVTTENSCLVGRNQTDIDSVEDGTYINDKDLRRQQVRDGTIDCFSPGEKSVAWQEQHQIVMQIGDNIKDIEGVTQESAVPEELLKRLDKDIIVLLNPIYGSW